MTQLCRIAKLVALMCCVLAAPVTQAADRAYIMIGDIDPTWFGEDALWRYLGIQQSGFYFRSFFHLDDVETSLQPVVDKYRHRYEAESWQVIYIDSAAKIDIRQALSSPDTRAFAWFSHGSRTPSGAKILITANNEEVSVHEVRQWAQERLVPKYPWMRELIASGGTYPESWKDTVSPAERQWRKAKFADAHLELEEAYLHVCNAMGNLNWRDTLVRQGGIVRGYPETAYLADTSRAYSRPMPGPVSVTIQGPEDKAVRQGDTVKLSALATGGVGPHTYEWQFPDGRKLRAKHINYVAEKPGSQSIFVKAIDISEPAETAEAAIHLRVDQGNPVAGSVAMPYYRRGPEIEKKLSGTAAVSGNSYVCKGPRRHKGKVTVAQWMQPPARLQQGKKMTLQLNASHELGSPAMGASFGATLMGAYQGKARIRVNYDNKWIREENAYVWHEGKGFNDQASETFVLDLPPQAPPYPKITLKLGCGYDKTLLTWTYMPFRPGELPPGLERAEDEVPEIIRLMNQRHELVEKKAANQAEIDQLLSDILDAQWHELAKARLKLSEMQRQLEGERQNLREFNEALANPSQPPIGDDPEMQKLFQGQRDRHAEAVAELEPKVMMLRGWLTGFEQNVDRITDEAVDQALTQAREQQQALDEQISELSDLIAEQARVIVGNP